jgi:RNA polymerase sigma factor (sigma-70 family)
MDEATGAKPWPDRLKAFFNTNAEVIHRYCLGIFRKRKHPPEDAENLAVHAFLNMWQAVDRYPPAEPKKVLPWIRCVATHVSIDHRKKMDKERVMDGPDVSGIQVRDPVDSFGELHREELAKVVREAVSRLPARYQMVVIQHMNGRTHKEIAEVIGASEKTSQRLWQEALDLLRPGLSPYM